MRWFFRSRTSAKSPTSLVLVLLLLMALAAGARSAYAQSSGPNRAGVVVQYASGKVGSRCVAFTEPQISGYELLKRSGLPLVAQVGSLGVAVCSINGTGCSSSANCFCQCQTPGEACAYWTFFEQTAQSQWRLSALGAAATTVKNGGMQAWVWGSGDSQNATMIPPALGFDEVCGASAFAPIPTREATAPPAPRAPTQMPSSPTPQIFATAPDTTPTINPSPAPMAVPTAEITPDATPAPAKIAPDSQANTSSEYIVFGGLCAGLLAMALIRRAK